MVLNLMSEVKEFFKLCEQYGFDYDKSSYDGLIFVYPKRGGKCRIYTSSEAENPTDEVKGDLLVMFMENTWID
jgi:hypothetical protein